MILEVLTETKMSIGYRFRDASCLDPAFGQPRLYLIVTSAANLRPNLVCCKQQHHGLAMYCWVNAFALYENCGSQNARCSISKVVQNLAHTLKIICASNACCEPETRPNKLLFKEAGYSIRNTKHWFLKNACQNACLHIHVCCIAILWWVLWNYIQICI